MYLQFGVDEEINALEKVMNNGLADTQFLLEPDQNNQFYQYDPEDPFLNRLLPVSHIPY